MSDTVSNALQDQLKMTMQQELILTRELLGNLHQEEQSLIVQDGPSWNQVMQHRASVLEKLKNLRLERVKTSSKIAEVLHLSNPSLLDKDFPLDLESCCEILHLSDQLIALTERLNLQQNRNQYLMTNAPRLTLAQTQTFPSKPKVTVATYPEDKLP